MSRFNRIELGMQAVNVSEATLEMQTKFDAVTGGFVEQSLISGGGPTATYLQPSLAHIHDNTLFGYVGPFAGTRSRFSIAPAIGTWQFISGLADYRRYVFVKPLTLAFRGLVMGRYGRDADRFPIFLGNPELIRGYTSGSYRSHECVANPGTSQQNSCAELDQLIGSKIAVANVELRFPLARYLVLGILPIGLPPIEGAIFYDVGVAWYDASNLKWDRTAAESPLRVRSPLRSWGGSIRANMFGLMVLRFDLAKPLDRGVKKAYWTVSIGPTF
jgi:outer membrane protein assembly factor BamA